MSSNTKVFGRSSAFPASEYDRGIDKLEYFAGQALVGLLASEKYDSSISAVVEDAYAIAVKMLAVGDQLNED